jgi:hypothetical protein
MLPSAVYKWLKTGYYAKETSIYAKTASKPCFS